MRSAVILVLLSASLPVSAASFDAYLAAGDKAYTARDCSAAKAQYSRAVGEAELFAKGDLRLVKALTKLGIVEDRLNELNEADATFTRGLPTVAAPRKNDPLVIGKFWYAYSRILGRLHRPEKATEAARAAIAQLSRTDDRKDLGLAFSGLGNHYDFLRRTEESEANRLRAKKLFEIIGSQHDLAVVCANLAMFYSRQNRMNDAWPAYRCALEAYSRSGGLVQRSPKVMLEAYASDLRAAGRAREAVEVDGTLAQISALPPDDAGTCK